MCSAPTPTGAAKPEVTEDDEEMMGDEEDEPETDFPEISVEELLDDMENMAIKDSEGDEAME